MGVTSVKVIPDPFTPTGCNAATITVKAYPNQTGMQTRIDNGPYGSFVSLTENPVGSGTYIGQWNGSDQLYGFIEPDSEYARLYVLDSDHNYSDVNDKTFKIHGVADVNATPYRFNPVAGQSTTITASTNSASPVTGLHLEAQIKHEYGSQVRALPMTESPVGTYQCSWDGRDSGGEAQSGPYSVYVYNTDCSSGIDYSASGSVYIDAWVSSIQVSPDPFTPTGCNAATITVKANPNQIGLAAEIYNPNGFDHYYRVSLPENPAGSGTYTGQWDGLDPYHGEYYGTIEPDSDSVTVDVVDSYNSRSAITQTFKLHGIASVSASPSPFDPSLGQSVAITASTNPVSPVTGLHLEARIEDANSNLVRALPITEGPAGTYTCSWEGKDSNGVAQSPGSYGVFVCSTDCSSGIFYSSSASVDIGTAAIGLAKQRADGTQVLLTGKVVTAVFPDCFYIEEANRSSGLKVVSSTQVEVGEQVYLLGSMNTVLERQLTADTVTWQGNDWRAQLPVPAPLFVAGRSLGGSTNGLCPGVAGGTGLNNIGLLVRCAGLVTSAGNDFFCLQDGSMYHDGSDYSAVRVPCEVSAVPPVGVWVEVVGIISCEQMDGKLRPLLRLRSSSDVMIVGMAGGVSSITVSRDPFTPTGCSAATITVKDLPNQIGLYAEINNPEDFFDYSQVSLTENPAGSGTYVGQWYGLDLYNGRIGPDSDSVTVGVLDMSNQRSAITQTFRMHGIVGVSASPSSFDLALGQSATITASTNSSFPVTGLHLEALIEDQNWDVLRALPMTESSVGTYECSWDGRGGNGLMMPSGTYGVYVYNTDCTSGIYYWPSASVTIEAGVSSIEVSPDPFMPTGCNNATITVKANPNQTDLYAEIDNPNFYFDSYVSLTENPVGSGTYSAQWNGVDWGIEPDSDSVTVDVIDPSYNHSTIKQTFKLHGIASLSASPSPFDPVLGQSAVITASTNSSLPITGWHLDAQIEGEDGSPVGAVPMTEGPAGTYQCSWDGKDGNRVVQRCGLYYVYVDNADCSSGTYYFTSARVEIGSSVIGLAKRHPDGSQVALYGKTVTAVFPDCFYIEEDDRSSGLKVVSSEGALVGFSVDVFGSMNAVPERQLSADTVTVQDFLRPIPAPLLVTVRSLGGSTNGLCLGVAGGAGLNNVGLLVRCVGRVTATGDDFFYLEDGSMHYDGSDYTGVRVQCDPAAVPQEGSIAEVTGIISCKQVGEKIRPLLRTRSSSDVLVIGN